MKKSARSKAHFAAACLLAAQAHASVAQESHQFANTKDKLAAFQSVLRTVRLRPATQTNPAYCKAFMRDLLAGNGVEPVEPVAEALSIDDPGIRKWRRCDGVTPEQMKTIDPQMGFDGIGIGGTLHGGPPYRYYRLEVDGNTRNGKEDVLYSEKYREENGALAGRSSYAWVDLEGCAIKQVFSMESTTPNRHAPPNLYRIHMPVIYKRMPFLLELFPFTDDPRVSNYNFDIGAVSAKVAMLCSWTQSTNTR